jgi:hypothetical protein
MARTPRRSRGNAEAPPPAAGASPPELVVLTRTEADMAASAAGVRSRAGMRTDRLEAILKDAGASMTPLFGATEDRARRAMGAAAAASGGRDPGTYYKVEAEGNLDAIADALRATDPVEAAYVKPGAEPPLWRQDSGSAAAAAASMDVPPATPDFTNRQGYLNAAPEGVDARWAWTQPGGRGANVRVIDIEGEWRFSHEDLTQNQGGVIGGGLPPAADRLIWRNHGTAVVGVFGGDVNAVGVTGICPDSNTRARSIFGAGNSSSTSITAAANALQAGDIILIELHRPGPRNNFQARQDQNGYIAVEWWPDDFAAILFATSRGIIVVEAAGNGAQNLDDAIYGVRPNNFPPAWRNPFNRANPDCGAVIVGAGAPPTLNHGPDRSRLGFSNFGACVDAQGWGEEVCTAGYGFLQGGANEDLWYTGTFNGTSSASPVVVGALGCVQGILRAASRPILNSLGARAVLRTTGSPQQDAPGRPVAQRIGNRPNIRGIIGQLIPKTIDKNLLKDITDKGLDKRLEKGREKAKDTKETKDFEKLPDKRREKVKETKEIKDSKETKEVKDIKDGDKTFKDTKEGKEGGEKNFIKDGKDQVENFNFNNFGSSAPGVGSLEDRVAALEAALSGGGASGGQAPSHFIGAELRPDVGGAAHADPADPTARLELLERLKAEVDAALAAARGGEGNG